MNADYVSYLALLKELSQTLGQLTETAQAKTAAVRRDDLQALDAYMKREQALSLSLRGCEQKRMAMLAEIGLADVPLGMLAQHYPVDLQPEAAVQVEKLQRQYNLYNGAAEVARTTLECNLHQIEQILGRGRIREEMEYTREGAQSASPTARKTDFRA